MNILTTADNSLNNGGMEINIHPEISDAEPDRINQFMTS